MPPKAFRKEEQSPAQQQVARVPEEDEAMESIEPRDISKDNIKEKDKELYDLFMKDTVHTFPFEMVHSDESDDDDEEEEEEEEEEGGEKVVKKFKKEKSALWVGFGDNGEFELKKGLLYDRKLWSDKDF